jgi:hypothetical protein
MARLGRLVGFELVIGLGNSHFALGTASGCHDFSGLLRERRIISGLLFQSAAIKLYVVENVSNLI